MEKDTMDTMDTMDTPTPTPAMEAQPTAADVERRDVERRDIERRRKIAAALRGNRNAAGKRTPRSA
jgi:hypothetical protein